MALAVAEMERALTVQRRYLFLSPHLDDAILSCGALLTALPARSDVTVVTIFTEASAPPHTRAATSFLRRCGVASAEDLYVERRREDSQVLTSLGVKPVNLGFCDALFRRRNGGAAASLVGRVFPELVHRYPTYWFDIRQGRVSRGDRLLGEEIATRLSSVISRAAPEVIFCPLGVGQHVDHLIVRELATRCLTEIIYYSEFPYVLNSESQTEFRRRRALEPWAFARTLQVKRTLIATYRTQMDGLFPGGRIPLIPEMYYGGAGGMSPSHEVASQA
jgi:LmbE family N-acetylglucosaminyl deacetylase